MNGTLRLAACLAWEASDSRERQGCEIVDYGANGGPIYRCARDARNMDETWFLVGGLGGLAIGSLVHVPRWEPVSSPAVGG